MKKIISILMSVLLGMMVLGGCGNKEKQADKNVKKEKIKVVFSGPKAPPTFPLLRMIETKALGDDIEYELKVWNTVEDILAMAANDNYNFMGIPMNVAIKLNNKGIDFSLLNVNTWGVMYLTSTDDSIKEWKDLKGKELYVPFKSAPPDIVTQHYISKAGLDPQKDVDIRYSTPAEIAQLVKAGKAKYAMNIEPFVTASKANKDVRIVFDYMKEWKKLEGKEYSIPNAGIVVSNKFADGNKELVDKFQKEYEKALKWTKENPQETGKLVEKYLKLNGKLIEKAMPNLGLDFKTAQDAKKDSNKYYKVLFDFMPKSVGGKLPNEEFYYKK